MRQSANKETKRTRQREGYHTDERLISPGREPFQVPCNTAVKPTKQSERRWQSCSHHRMTPCLRNRAVIESKNDSRTSGSVWSNAQCDRCRSLQVGGAEAADPSLAARSRQGNGDCSWRQKQPCGASGHSCREGLKSQHGPSFWFSKRNPEFKFVHKIS